MYPQIEINYLAILGAILANIVIGFLWYGPVFGKLWMKEMGFNPDMKPGTRAMIQSMILMIIGAFFTAYVISHSSAVWRPSVWSAGEDSPAWSYGFYAALFTWVGFYIPVLFNSVSWEQRTWKLFSINAAYHFINLQIVAFIVSYWR